MEGLMGVCVLIVEDEPIVALDLASILEDAGADVLGPALTLEAADRLSENGHIAVAVLDIRLGAQTVDSVARKLHQRSVPIIFHTGHGSAAALKAQWPDSYFLLKPAKTEELLRMITAALRSELPSAS
jgi:CheY-like chemotaxis protein